MKSHTLIFELAGIRKSHSWNVGNPALSNPYITFFPLQTQSQSGSLLAMAELLYPTNTSTFYPVTKHQRHKLSPSTQTPNHTRVPCSQDSLWGPCDSKRRTRELLLVWLSLQSHKLLYFHSLSLSHCLHNFFPAAEIWIRKLTWNKNNLTGWKNKNKGGFCPGFLLELR